MKKSYKDYRALALDILRGEWLIQDSPALRAAARSFLRKENIDVTLTGDKPKSALVTIKGESFEADPGNDGAAPARDSLILVVPVHGTLTKYDNCTGCSVMEVVDTMEEYRGDESIVGVVLDIDSPGGVVNAIMPLVAEIRKWQNDGKPVIAHVDQCCSAAYWIASQTDAIFADNIMSQIGSIGAYAQIVDDRENKQTGEKTIDIYAEQSTEKNREYRAALDGDVKPMQDRLSKTVNIFIEAVKSGRPDIKADAEGVMSGAVFMAPEAVDLGMVNGMADIQECVKIAYVRANV